MVHLKLAGEALLPEMMEGVREIAGELELILDDNGMEVHVIHTSEGLWVRKDGDGATLGFNKRVEFHRALGILVQHFNEPSVDIREINRCQFLGAMVDNSRNAVMNIPSIKRLCRYMALMGHDTLMLYTEDTFEIEGYPYFGYMRGRFTSGELQECDHYAHMLGIELVPCIQTLAHLNAALRWHAFQDIRDCNDILLAGEEKTYALIEAMLASMSKSLKSRNINIGMDEAEMLGLGKYLQKNGYSNRSEIMLNHLNRVVELCRKFGYKPMMWSDMFFKLASEGSGYYGGDIPKSVIGTVPKEVTLVYWDYYSTHAEKASKMLDKHLQFNNPCAFAGGAWRWRGYAPLNGYSILNSRIILEQCNKKGVGSVFVTAWGDDGSECSMFTILPVLQLFAENSYARNMGEDHLDARLRICTGMSLNDFLLLDKPNQVPGNKQPGICGANPSKYLLYQDILMGLFDKHVEEETYSEHFRQTSLDLANAAGGNPKWKDLFISLSHLCDILELKCDMGIRLKKAYDAGDKPTLKAMCNRMNVLQDRVALFYEDIRRQWMSENKPFGFDVVSMRLGALKTRISEAQRRTEEYLSDRISRIEELEQERLYFDGSTDLSKSLLMEVDRWASIVTANVV